MLTVQLKDRVLEYLNAESQKANPFMVKTADIAGAVETEATEVRRVLSTLTKEDKISTRRRGPNGTEIYVGRSGFWGDAPVKTGRKKAQVDNDPGERVVGTFYCVECGARNVLTERVEIKCSRCNEVLLHPGKYCIYCGFSLASQE